MPCSTTSDSRKSFVPFGIFRKKNDSLRWDLRYGCNKSLRIWMSRRFEDLLGKAYLYELAGSHDGNAPRKLRDNR